MKEKKKKKNWNDESTDGTKHGMMVVYKTDGSFPWSWAPRDVSVSFVLKCTNRSYVIKRIKTKFPIYVLRTCTSKQTTIRALLWCEHERSLHNGIDREMQVVPTTYRIHQGVFSFVALFPFFLLRSMYSNASCWAGSSMKQNFRTHIHPSVRWSTDVSCCSLSLSLYYR